MAKYHTPLLMDVVGMAATCLGLGTTAALLVLGYTQPIIWIATILGGLTVGVFARQIGERLEIGA